MKTVAWTPASRAAHATAWPWLPALAATTPAARSESDNVAILLTAPRILNEPVRCRFSAFSHTSRPVIRDNVSDGYAAVTRATPSSRARAVSMSASVGAVLIAIDLEHLGEKRLHGVAGAGHQHEHDGVGDPDHLDLALACADRLQEDQVLAGRVQDQHRLQRRLGESAEVAARAHRA